MFAQNTKKIIFYSLQIYTFTLYQPAAIKISSSNPPHYINLPHLLLVPHSSTATTRWRGGSATRWNRVRATRRRSSCASPPGPWPYENTQYSWGKWLWLSRNCASQCDRPSARAHRVRSFMRSWKDLFIFPTILHFPTAQPTVGTIKKKKEKKNQYPQPRSSETLPNWYFLISIYIK